MTVRWYVGTSWLLIALFVSACVNNRPSEQYVLRPVDSADSSKRFTYGFRARPPGGQPQGAGGERQSQQGEQGGRGGPPSGNQMASFDQLREELEDYMAATTYCTQGYFIYDETFNGNEYLLHGECQESIGDE